MEDMEDIQVRITNPIMEGRLTVFHRITIFEAIHKIKSLRWNTNKNIFKCLLNRILYETRSKNLLDLKLKIFHHILKHKVRVNEAFSSREKIYLKFTKMYTAKMGHRFHVGVGESDIQNIHLQEGVYWNCDDNGTIWGIYKDEESNLDIQWYGANIEEQVFQHLQSNPYYYSGTIEGINF